MLTFFFGCGNIKVQKEREMEKKRKKQNGVSIYRTKMDKEMLEEYLNSHKGTGWHDKKKYSRKEKHRKKY